MSVKKRIGLLAKSNSKMQKECHYHMIDCGEADGNFDDSDTYWVLDDVDEGVSVYDDISGINSAVIEALETNLDMADDGGGYKYFVESELFSVYLVTPYFTFNCLSVYNSNVKHCNENFEGVNVEAIDYMKHIINGA